MQSHSSDPIKFNFVLIGDTKVGKSSLFQRLKNPSNEPLEPSYTPTIGLDFANKLVEVATKPCRLNIWDASGQERFLDVTKAYLPNAVGIICMFDVTDKESFKNVSKWIQFAQEFARKDTEYLLIGNKIDLEGERQVTYDEGHELAKSYGMDFVEISAKDQLNIEKIEKELLPKALKVCEKRILEGSIEDYGNFIKGKDLLEKSKGSSECSAM